MGKKIINEKCEQINSGRTKGFMINLLLLSIFYFFLPVVSSAQGLTATLQKGDQMTPFYGLDAFKEALAAADSSDVIVLSPGTFSTGIASNKLKITKPVTIIGSGGIDISPSTNLDYLEIVANRVKLEGLRISQVFLGNVNYTTFFRSYITDTLSCNTGTKHINTLIDQCKVSRDKAIASGTNYCIKNSVINYLYNNNTSNNLAYIENSVIFLFCASSGSASTTYAPHGVYKNNVILHVYNSYSSSYCDLHNSSQAYNNVFVASFASWSVGNGNWEGISQTTIFGITRSFDYSMSYFKVTGTTYKGTDGKEIGIYGGGGFSNIPTNPQIQSKTIDSQTDKDGKINVKITVKAQP